MAMLYVGTDVNSLVPVPRDPSSFEWGCEPVNSSTAGRSNDANATMHTERITQKRKISLKWVQLDADTTAEILQMFNPEYVYVRYWDAMGGRWEVRQFYTGATSAPLRWFQTWIGTRYESVSFDIIEA